MAAAIHYLSADNHVADSPPVRPVNRELPSAYFRLIFEGRFRLLWPSMSTWFEVLELEEMFLHSCPVYFHIHFLYFHIQLYKNTISCQ